MLVVSPAVSQVSVPFRGFRGLQAPQSPPPRASKPSRVSVPFRGFRGLQGQRVLGSGTACGGAFQSPSGVLGVCRETVDEEERRLSQKVSVPFRGFRGLQEALNRLNHPDVASFQSPSGVLGVCRTRGHRASRRVQRRVSVPFRGFRGLQAVSCTRQQAAHAVSVPFRGFRGLQGRVAPGRRPFPRVFQSPSGVLGVCRKLTSWR